MHPIKAILADRKTNKNAGIYSCCSANEIVLRAVMEKAAGLNMYALVEATANQVDQFGGYTGMKPEDFAKFAIEIAKSSGLARDRLILGGDHLGPLTFSEYPEEKAMALATELVKAYVLAGFTKIHLDTSMKLNGDGEGPLCDEVIARRGAALCAACEEAFAELFKDNSEATPPVYVIGSEVPIPGGAKESEDALSVTGSDAAQKTINSFKNAFYNLGLNSAWTRVIALVVQPGVEFGDDRVFVYDSGAAKNLSGLLEGSDTMVFEAHSTDYQPKEALRQLVQDGFAVLKVGPALTFALREGLFALENIEKELVNLYNFSPSNFRGILESEMLRDDSRWKKYYHGEKQEQAYKCMFSFSDRARYYLPNERVNEAVNTLIANLNVFEIPITLISMYMPRQYTKIQSGTLDSKPENLLKSRVEDCIQDYVDAVSA